MSCVVRKNQNKIPSCFQKYSTGFKVDTIAKVPTQTHCKSKVTIFQFIWREILIYFLGPISIFYFISKVHLCPCHVVKGRALLANSAKMRKNVLIQILCRLYSDFLHTFFSLYGTYTRYSLRRKPWFRLHATFTTHSYDQTSEGKFFVKLWLVKR